MCGVPEVFADRIHEVEVIGSVVRIALTGGPDRLPAEQRQVVGYLLWPIDRIPEGISFMVQWYADHIRTKREDEIAASLVH